MRVELMMPAGPIPVLPHGARPLPMVMLHVANCGRNCGIRKGRPIPSALPRIDEDYYGESKEDKPRMVKFSETLPTRDWSSEKFKLAKQKPIIVHSPSTHQLELERIFDMNVDSDGQDHSDDDDDDDDDDYQLLVNPDNGGQLATILIHHSETPPDEQIPIVIVVHNLEKIFKQHQRYCAEKCGRSKRRTQPGLFPVIMEDVEGEMEETEVAISANDTDSTKTTYSPSNTDSPNFADSESSTPASITSSFSCNSLRSLEESECTYITSPSGLLGLGLLHMPDFTSMSTVSSDLNELATPPESPVRREMDITDYRKSLVDEWRTRVAKGSMTTSAYNRAFNNIIEEAPALEHTTGFEHCQQQDLLDTFRWSDLTSPLIPGHHSTYYASSFPGESWFRCTVSMQPGWSR
ncbi:hypothetical protein ACEPAF_5484 [Sanghuangporus sanghuang]